MRVVPVLFVGVTAAVAAYMVARALLDELEDRRLHQGMKRVGREWHHPMCLMARYPPRTYTREWRSWCTCEFERAPRRYYRR